MRIRVQQPLRLVRFFVKENRHPDLVQDGDCFTL